MCAWLRVFLLTQTVELLVAVPLLRAAEPRLARRALLALAATALTHPVVWFMLPEIGLTTFAYVWVAECFAWFAEAAFYAATLRGLGAPRALLVSLAANGASLAAAAAARGLGFDW